MKLALSALVCLSMSISPNCTPSSTPGLTGQTISESRQGTIPKPPMVKPSWRPEPYTHF